MTGGSLACYPFPDDNGATLHRVISRLPESLRLAMSWKPTQDWLLEVPPHLSVALAVNYVRCGVRRLDPTMQSGLLFVPAAAVDAIQGVLVKRSSVSAIWSRVEGVEFATDKARRAFEAVLSSRRTKSHTRTLV